MNKKIIGIIIFMLFLFQTLPVVKGLDTNNNMKNSLLKSDDSINEIEFQIVYGSIINHLENIGDSNWYYNITPVNLKIIRIGWNITKGFYTEKEIITGGPYYMPIGSFIFHGFITKNYMIYMAVIKLF